MGNGRHHQSAGQKVALWREGGRSQRASSALANKERFQTQASAHTRFAKTRQSTHEATEVTSNRITNPHREPAETYPAWRIELAGLVVGITLSICSKTLPKTRSANGSYRPNLTRPRPADEREHAQPSMPNVRLFIKAIRFIKIGQP